MFIISKAANRGNLFAVLSLRKGILYGHAGSAGRTQLVYNVILASENRIILVTKSIFIAHQEILRVVVTAGMPRHGVRTLSPLEQRGNSFICTYSY